MSSAGPLFDLDHPLCSCGTAMRLSTVEPLLKDAQTEIHAFECPACGVTLRVMHDNGDAAI